MKNTPECFVKVRRRGKTRGRPSKWEMFVSKSLSDIMKDDSFRSELLKCMSDTLIYGTGVFDAGAVQTSAGRPRVPKKK